MFGKGQTYVFRRIPKDSGHDISREIHKDTPNIDVDYHFFSLKGFNVLTTLLSSEKTSEDVFLFKSH